MFLLLPNKIVSGSDFPSEHAQVALNFERCVKYQKVLYSNSDLSFSSYCLLESNVIVSLLLWKNSNVVKPNCSEETAHVTILVS